MSHPERLKFIALSRELDFVPVELLLRRNGLLNLFVQQNNKTVAKTLARRRYSHLSPEARRRYPHAANERLVNFLYRLKMSGDNLYRQFLNRHGDSTYCEFVIREHLNSKGLYCFVLGSQVGMCQYL